jgi:hypothetical protein
VILRRHLKPARDICPEWLLGVFFRVEVAVQGTEATFITN